MTDVLKVWTITSYKGYVSGVYVDEDLAKHSCGPNDSLEEWQPEITDKAIKNLKKIVGQNDRNH